MFNLKGPQEQNPRTTCGPRTTVWETLVYPKGVQFLTSCKFYILELSKQRITCWSLTSLSSPVCGFQYLNTVLICVVIQTASLPQFILFTAKFVTKESCPTLT